MLQEIHEECVPMRFRYMMPLYGYVRKNIEKSCGGQSGQWLPGAADSLKDLFYEQLDLIAGMTFWTFFEEQFKQYSDKERMAYLEQCGISQLEGWWDKLFLQYPVLERLVRQWFTDFTAHVVSLCQRLVFDLDAISGMLGKAPGRIRMIDSGDSDIHEGHCVHIITFEDGRKIVYKPRSLKLDQIWQDYLQDMALKSGIGPFKVPWIMQRGEYGYEEYIASAPVSGEYGFSEYFRRCGFLLGIAYALQGNDLHAENMIACGNCPVLIDLETGVRACGNTVFSDVKNPIEKRYQFDSVLRTNLLPFLTMGRTITPGDDAFTVRKDFFKNLPYDKEGVRSGENYVQELTDGFCIAYDTIQKYGITKDFSDCSVRFLLRNTSFYRNMQKISYMPENMKDEVCFERRLDNLAQLYHTVGVRTDSGFFGVLLEREKQAIRKGYIPRLTLNMRDRWNGDKRTLLVQLLEGKPAYMNAADKAWQCQKIRISLNAAIAADRLYFKCLHQWKAESVSFKQIGEIMHSRISYWKNRLAQEGKPEGIVVCRENNRYYLTLLPWNMMAGVPGLLPALAAWYRISGDQQALNLFLQIVQKLYRQLEKTDLKLYKPGLSEGLEGILCMVLLVRSFFSIIWIEQIYNLISAYADPGLYDMNTMDENAADILFEQGLHCGMDGVDFPSFFDGEGGWLYRMLRNAAKDKIPSVCFNAVGSGRGKADEKRI